MTILPAPVMTNLPAPVILEYEGIQVVRDDLLPGGTKRRAIHTVFDADHDEYVYASPAFGLAQVALALAARDYQKRATITVAKRTNLHPLTRQAQEAGATIIEVPMGFLTVTQARAREYAARTPRCKLVPFGLDDPAFIAALAGVARTLPAPHEVWSVASSGVLTRALQLAWPEARFYGVQVGARPNAGRATMFHAPETFTQKAQLPPPFPANPQYDAKVWRFIKRHATPGALFWSVS